MFVSSLNVYSTLFTLKAFDIVCLYKWVCSNWLLDFTLDDLERSNKGYFLVLSNGAGGDKKKQFETVIWLFYLFYLEHTIAETG